MTTIEDRVARLEGKHESLDVYLPALLESMRGMEARLEGRLDAVEGRLEGRLDAVEASLRASHLERIGIVLSILIAAGGIIASILLTP